MVYLADQLVAEAIREEAKYGGVRLRMPAGLGRARTTLRLDVSVGEPIMPTPSVIRYPTLLGSDSFEIVGYAIETVLAEKIETMLRRGRANTRDRDFADVWLILHRHVISGKQFSAALTATAEYRGTELTPLGSMLGDLASVRQPAWTAFLQT